ncbi:MAG: hypothetical protein KAU62_00915 [Candidatus Heimdallarchaeota archaeon]|nr:hypothetical protein [Candidatus Heimdallarchaeota archaeon]MCG3254610.1 hypothetical protein [Candidatus Heimdallarchaeota archaeon]MCK4609693.1 hypothetical protein [Candidatus Heimdallarchaeota archaeon]
MGSVLLGVIPQRADAFENYATHTVIVTITSPTLTTPTSTKTTIPQTTLLSISWILIPLSLFAVVYLFHRRK